MHNPSAVLVMTMIVTFLNQADYTFIIFSGHGFINAADGNRQYVELSDQSIPISNLRTNASRQTLIIDACRGYYDPRRDILKGFSESYDHFLGDIDLSRQIFDNAVVESDEGWTILYSASANQTSLDTASGGAFLLSLLKAAEHWQQSDKRNNVLDLFQAHRLSTSIIKRDFETIQVPVINDEKRHHHFPLAVKTTLVYG